MRRLERPGKKIVSLMVTLAMAGSLVAGTGLTGYATDGDSVSGTDPDTMTAAGTVNGADTGSVSVNGTVAADTDTGTDAGTDAVDAASTDADSITESAMLPAADDSGSEEDAAEGAVMVTAGEETSCFDGVADAFEYANTQTSCTVTLLADCGTGEVLCIEDGVDLTLDLAGYTLSQTGNLNSSVITVKGSFTLEDSSEDGTGIVTGGRVTSGNGGGVYVTAAAGFTMNGGIVSGNSTRYDGGGVYVEDTGSFVLNGGSVSGNSASGNGGGVYADGSFEMNGGVVSDNELIGYKGYGGGVYAAGAFTLNDGTISGNSGAAHGGGAYIADMNDEGTNAFVMNGGSISGNTAVDYGGGGITVHCNDFYFYGGSISGNATTGAVSEGGGIYMISGTIVMTDGASVSGNTSVCTGAGVFLWLGATLDMRGGSISGNILGSTGKRGGVQGAGVYADGSSYKGKNCTIIMSGGEITDNAAVNAATALSGAVLGGGIYGISLDVTISGCSVISGNTANGAPSNYYLAEGETFTLGDGLAAGADIGVTTEDEVTAYNGERRITSEETGTEYYKTAIDYISSDEGYEKCIGEDGGVAFYVWARSYGLSWTLSRLACSNEADVIENSADYTATLTADEGYEIPVFITVTVGDEVLAESEYMYDALTGGITIPASVITGDVSITAEAVEAADSPEMDEDGYYLLESGEDVLWFCTRVLRNGDVSARVTGDITITSGFTGIGTEAHPFEGTFDGAGYEISVDISSDGTAGLFVCADGAVIKDLTVSGSVVSTAYTGTGGIVGAVGENGLTMENCTNMASVSGEGYTGGLIGNASGCAVAVSDCVNYGDVTCTYTGDISTYVSVTGEVLPVTGQGFYTGGIVGYAAAGTVAGVFNYGVVSGNSHVGGLIGMAALEYSTGSLTVSDCMNYGAVDGVDSPVGGIAGKFSGVTNSLSSVMFTVIHCGNEGDITAVLSGDSGKVSVGGIAGAVVDESGTSTFRSLYNAGSVTVTGKNDAYSYAGGIFGTTSCGMTDVYNVGAVKTQYKRQYAGGIFGGENSAATLVIVGNAYNAGAVMMGEAAGGNMTGYVASSCWTFFVNSYFLDTLEGDLSYFGTSLYVLSSATEEFTLTDSGYVREGSLTGYDSMVVISDEEIEAMKVSADTLAELASTLGDGFKANTDSSLHLGYPVLSWEYVPAETTDDPEVDDTEGDDTETGGTVEAVTYLLGDVNGDGAVDTKDVTVLARYEAGAIEDSDINLNAADVNGDGVTDTRDVTILSRHCAGVVQDYAIGSEISISAAD